MNKQIGNKRDAWVDGLMGSLTLEQKVGQLMVFPFYGTFITPDVRELIEKYHVGGLRIAQKFHPGVSEHRSGKEPAWHVKRSMREPDDKTYDIPSGLSRVSCTASEFAATLNELRDYAMNRPGGVPLHMAFDQEGEGADFLFEQRLFPYPMGLRASGDEKLAYRVARAVGVQARALGANMIHSPVLDVNTDPRNPEIGPRAYSDNPDEVMRWALESLRGFQETGIIATAKHFPGRGASDVDAHFGLPVIDLDAKTLQAVHIAPYKALIDAGLPAVMAAFTAYPALGSDRPAATAPEIIQGILREQLNFNGVVTTDNTQMGGLLEKFELGEAIVQCLIAGCDLVLCRSYTPSRITVLQTVMDAVRQGRITEQRLDEAVQRILRMRWDMGLAENGGKVDAERAGDPFNDPEIIRTARDSARASTLLLRDRDQLVPIGKDKKVLLIEQVHHFHSFINNGYSHPGMLWQEMLRIHDQVSAVHVNEKVTDQDIAAVKARLKNSDADVIVSTCYYNYRSGAQMTPMLEVLKDSGKSVILVSNTPYEAFGPVQDFGTVLVSFCPSGRENLRTVAQMLFGELQPTASLNLRWG